MDNYLQLTQDILAAFGRGDMQVMLSHLSDNIILDEYQAPGVAMGGRWTGPDGFLQFLQTLNQTLEFRHFEPEQFIVQGNKVVIVGHEIMVARNTGTEYRNDWIHVWTYEGEKLANVQAYNDTAAVATALNVLTPA